MHHALIDLAPSKERESDKYDPRSSKEKVSASAGDRKDRNELLISRLVRLHWERMHLIRVKNDYHEKFGRHLEEDIEDYVRGEDFREFCMALCEGAP